MSAMPQYVHSAPIPKPLMRVALRRRHALERGDAERAASQGYRFRGASAVLMDSEASEVIIDGPAGTGKSLACFVKLDTVCRASAGARVLVLRKTRSSLTETGLVTFEEEVLGVNNPMAQGAKRGTRRAYRYPNGSQLVVGGMDKASRVLSASYDVIFVQQAEELTESEWEHLGTRLRHGATPYHQLIGDCNPDRPTHWIKQRSERGQLSLLHSRHQDNPKLHDGTTWTPRGIEYVHVRLGALTGVRRLRFLEGQWAAAEGMIYGDVWDASRNLIDPFPIPREWRRLGSIDFGYTNPFVCGWWAVDPDGRMYLYRQVYMSRRTVRAHADLIARLTCGTDPDEWGTLDQQEKLRRIAHSGRLIVGTDNFHPGEHVPYFVCDHDAEDRATLRENGIPTRAAHKAVKYGIEKVGERMKLAGDDKPRLFIFRDCVVEVDESLRQGGVPWATEQEVDGYVYATGPDNKPNKEEPLKMHDHGLDQTRYAVCDVERGGGMRVEVF